MLHCTQAVHVQCATEGQGVDIHVHSCIVTAFCSHTALNCFYNTVPKLSFNCGQWLARAEDDGSVERFLTADKVPQTISKSCTISALGRSALRMLVIYDRHKQ